MGSFAADHVITESGVFRETVRLAVDVARDDWLVTIGIDPVSPSPAFGYVHLGAGLPEHPGAFRVRAFVEKPSVHMAARVPRERAVPLERRHVRGPADRAAGPARGVRPHVRRHAAGHRGRPDAARRAVADAAQDRRRPRRRRAGGRRGTGGGRARVVRLGRRRRLRLARRAAGRHVGPRLPGGAGRRGPGAGRARHRAGRARLRPDGRGHRHRRRGRRRHPRRAAGHHAQPGRRRSSGSSRRSRRRAATDLT